MKQIASLPAVERPAVPKAPPGEGDLGGTRPRDSWLGSSDLLPFIRLNG